MRRLLIPLLTAGLLLCGSGAARAAGAEPHAGRPVQDLHYGDVLFHFYQDDFFDALVEFNAYRQLGFAVPHAADGELLLGGMLLSYGQDQEATAIFHRLLDSTAKPEVRDRAWFQLARVSFERGADAQARDALSRIQAPLSGRLEDERQMLTAQVLMSQQRWSEAAARLAAWKGSPDWAGYAQFNLGVALVRAQRVDEGLEALDAAGRRPAADDEGLAVRDRANLALGYAAVQSNRPEQAGAAFKRVRLEGPWSNQALLGLGWAESSMGHFREALVPWTELNRREDLLDPAVQESRLALPYAMMGLKAYGTAATRYHEAITAFDAEAQRLDASIARIRRGALIDLLVDKDAPETMGGNWHLAKMPAAPESRYLVHLMASDAFQEQLRNYRDLLFMRANLTRWSNDVAVFSDMLATRQLAFVQQLPLAKQALQHTDLDVLAARREALAARLSGVEQRRDPAGFATGGEALQESKLADLEARVARLGSQPQAQDLRDRVRVLRGVLAWNLSHAWSQRQWEARRTLAQLDQQLTLARTRQGELAQAQSTEPARLGQFGQRIDEQSPRIAALLKRTDALIARQANALQDLAIAELEDYRKRLGGYAAEARFSLATVYDHAAARGPAP